MNLCRKSCLQVSGMIMEMVPGGALPPVPCTPVKHTKTHGGAEGAWGSQRWRPWTSLRGADGPAPLQGSIVTKSSPVELSALLNWVFFLFGILFIFEEFCVWLQPECGRKSDLVKLYETLFLPFGVLFYTWSALGSQDTHMHLIKRDKSCPFGA